jgi:hypothetical protein
MTADAPGNSPTDGVATASPLDRFRAIVFADTQLQLELSQPRDAAVFAELAARRARERGVRLGAEEIAQAARPDPLGLARWEAGPPLTDGWPEGDWLPVHIDGGATPYVDWAHFAGAPLTAPFFEDARREAGARPFNALFRRRSSLAGFSAAATPARALIPSGLIFHMSRCGSTLVAQMLAASPRDTVISEAPPLDGAIQLEVLGAASGRDGGVVAAMVSALGRRQTATRGALFLKHDSWHVISLPLIRRALPRAPWVFLYRDPVEVLVSQARQPGMQIVPGMLPAQIIGTHAPAMAADEYGAAVLGRICTAAGEAFAAGGGLLVNYNELPGAFFTRILPHFGVAPGARTAEAMWRAAERDAKAPYAAFTPDGPAKRAEATPRQLELAARHMAAPYRRLEALRTGRARS